MPFIVKSQTRIDPTTKRVVNEVVRAPVADDDLGQDTAEQHAARMAAPAPPTLAERVDALEKQLTALRGPVK